MRSLFSLDENNDGDYNDGSACLPTEEESKEQRCERLGFPPVIGKLIMLHLHSFANELQGCFAHTSAVLQGVPKNPKNY